LVISSVVLITIHLNESKPSDRDGSNSNKDSESDDWSSFKGKHGKKYQSEGEETKRKWNHASHAAKVAAHNDRYSAGLESYSRAVNEFSDMDEEEFNGKMNGFKVSKNSRPRSVVDESEQNMAFSKRQTLPTSVDWRTSGCITPIKNQGTCGSCWAFSATGALEAQKCFKTKVATTFSEQNLMDCAGSTYGNYGCNGGNMNGAFSYVVNNKGLSSEAGYSYLGYVQSTCNYKLAYNSTSCKGNNWVTASESALQTAVAQNGPVSIAVDASQASFHSYSSGVYKSTACSSSNLNHGVLVVGYGALNGVQYWLIKNSWGTGWGINGYMYLARNANNMCGVASYAMWPSVW